jgi:uncharacterized protein (DUF2237 family)
MPRRAQPQPEGAHRPARAFLRLCRRCSSQPAHLGRHLRPAPHPSRSATAGTRCWDDISTSVCPPRSPLRDTPPTRPGNQRRGRTALAAPKIRRAIPQGDVWQRADTRTPLSDISLALCIYAHAYIQGVGGIESWRRDGAGKGGARDVNAHVRRGRCAAVVPLLAPCATQKDSTSTPRPPPPPQPLAPATSWRAARWRPRAASTRCGARLRASGVGEPEASARERRRQSAPE